MMKIFSLPLNPKLNQNQFKELAEFIKRHKELIYDVYFTCRIPPFEQDAMGDVFLDNQSSLTSNALYLQELTGVKVSATFNNIEVRADQNNLDLWIENFRPMYKSGIRTVTIPHTSWVMTGQIQEEFPDLEIKNTILRKINTAADVANHARAGFHYINIDRNLMRNRDELEKIKRVKEKYNVKIALLANESCYGACPIMDEHFQFNNTRTTGPQYFNDPISRISCSMWDIKESSGHLKTANLPPWKEDWDEMLEYIDVFKMHGRESLMVFEGSLKMIEAYSKNQEHLITTLDEYINDTNMGGKPIEAWRQFIKNCKFDCWDCDKCDKLYEAKNGKRTPDKRDLIIDTICTTYLD